MSVILFFALLVGACANGSSLQDVSTWQLTSAATILRSNLHDMLLQGRLNEINKVMLEQTRSMAALRAGAIARQFEHQDVVMIDMQSITGRVHADHEQHLALSPGVLFAILAVAIVLVSVPCVLLYCPDRYHFGISSKDKSAEFYSSNVPSHFDSPLLASHSQVPDTSRQFMSPVQPVRSPFVSQAPPPAQQGGLGAFESARPPTVHAVPPASASPCIGCASPYTHSRLFVERCMANRSSTDVRDVFTWFAKDSVRQLYRGHMLEVKNSHGVFAMAQLCRDAAGGRPACRLEIACAPELGVDRMRDHMFLKPVAIIAPLEYPAQLGANATMKGYDGEFCGYFQRKRHGFTLSGGSHDFTLSVEPVEIGLMIMVHSRAEQIAAVRATHHRNDVRIDVKQGADRMAVVSAVVAAMIASQDAIDYFTRGG